MLDTFRSKSFDFLSIDSDVFFVERSLGQQSLPKHNTPETLKSTKLSGAMAKENIKNPSVASGTAKCPNRVRLWRANNPIWLQEMSSAQSPQPNRLGVAMQSIYLYDANILGTHNGDGNESSHKRWKPLSPASFQIFEIWTPSMTTSTLNAWNTSSDMRTFYSDEPRKISVLSSSSPLRSPSRHRKKVSLGIYFSKKSACRSTYAKPANKNWPEKGATTVSQRNNEKWT